MGNVTNFERFGTMIDCSRDAVMNLPSLKRWVDLISDLGYNCLLLYMEDTYEVDENPYFGRGRGRYSKEELKEIDAYAKSKGVEVIPCIQTLAHLNAIVNIPVYADMVDCDDILLVGDERVYTLIDNMFKSLSESLTTRHINIGMDEAHMIGRGKFYDMNGEVDRTELLVNHIRRVAEIGEKYGLTLSIWSDMFFRLASNGEYYADNIEVSDEIKALIPSNVDLVYWDYYRFEVEHYDNMMKAHDKIKANYWFAGGLWTWSGFAPLNKFSIKATNAGIASCLKHGVKNVFFTMWGDDTAECSKFAALPSLFYATEVAKGNTNMASIKSKFKEKYGIAFDRFLTVDLENPGTHLTNTSKYLLYNDLFNARMTSLIREDTAEIYKELSRKLSLLKKDENFGYLFNTLKALCDVAAVKADLCVMVKEAYDAKDIDAIQLAVADGKKLIRLMKEFYKTFEKQWMFENKGHGFDVHDIRIGGMIVRTEHCVKRLEAFINGEIEKIEELEDPLLDYFGRDELIKDNVHLNSFVKIYSANIISW